MLGNSLQFLVNEHALLIYLYLCRYFICHVVNHFQLLSQFLYSNLCNFCVLLLDRFPEAAELDGVYGTKIRGMINTIDLSPNTHYAAYLVFKMIDVSILGLEGHRVEFLVRVKSGHSNVMGPYYRNATVCLYRNVKGRNHEYNKVVGLQRSSVRSDRWFEIEMGEFFNSGLKAEEIQMNVNVEIKDSCRKTRLLVDGIEVRPRRNN